MTIASPDLSFSEVSEPPRRHRFTRDEYYRMADMGLFQGIRVELIDGEILEMAPQKNPHALGVSLAAQALGKVFAPDYWVRNQLPLNLGEAFDPEPDVAVVKGDMRSFSDHPTSALLVIEVADTTLRFDRTVKSGIYARSGIADYWIINIAQKCLEVYREPVEDPTAKFGFTYRASLSLRAGDNVSPLAMPNSVIPVANLLP